MTQVPSNSPGGLRALRIHFGTRDTDMTTQTKLSYTQIGIFSFGHRWQHLICELRRWQLKRRLVTLFVTQCDDPCDVAKTSGRIFSLFDQVRNATGARAADAVSFATAVLRWLTFSACVRRPAARGATAERGSGGTRPLAQKTRLTVRILRISGIFQHAP